MDDFYDDMFLSGALESIGVTKSIAEVTTQIQEQPEYIKSLEEEIYKTNKQFRKERKKVYAYFLTIRNKIKNQKVVSVVIIIINKIKRGVVVIIFAASL